MKIANKGARSASMEISARFDDETATTQTTACKREHTKIIFTYSIQQKQQIDPRESLQLRPSSQVPPVVHAQSRAPIEQAAVVAVSVVIGLVARHPSTSVPVH
jgi:hypothetical protein